MIYWRKGDPSQVVPYGRIWLYSGPAGARPNYGLWTTYDDPTDCSGHYTSHYPYLGDPSDDYTYETD